MSQQNDPIDPKLKEQVRHLAGLAALMDWRQRWSSVRGAVVQKGDQLTLGMDPSARFAVALPRARHVGKFPVILIQPDEAEWMGLISWSRIHVSADGAQLSWVSRRHIGIGDLPDLPAFAITIELGEDARTLPFSKFSHLDVRRYWNNGKEWQIEGGRPFRQLPISPVGSPLFTGSDLVIGETFQDKVRRHSAKLSSVQPTFLGVRPDMTSWSDDFLLKVSTAPKES